MIYAGTVWLHRTEEEVMRMTPRKLHALLRVHYDILKQQNGVDTKKNAPTGYIDNIPGW